MKSGKTETLLIAASGILWLLMVGFAAAGEWFTALVVLLPLLLVYGVLGASHEGRFDLQLVAFPTLVWLVMWGGAFWLGNHYAEAFAGRSPDFTILGFHPSFAAIIAFFWILPTLLMGFGFEAVKDRWLSRARWDEFLRRIHETQDEDAGDGGAA
jgi:hypothetical protein